MAGKVILMKMELDREGVRGILTDPATREPLKAAAEEIFAAIPESDAKGAKQSNGTYDEKFMDLEVIANDGRVGVDVGVHGADHGIFRLMTLQKALRSIGAKLSMKRGM